MGYYIRSKMEDTPHFAALRERNEVERNPLKAVFTSKRHLKAIALTIFLPALNGPGYYLLFAYMPTYLKTQLGTGNNFTMVQALMVTAVSLVAIIISIPLMARLSDRIGRKPVLAASAVLMALVSYPMFAMITTGNMAAGLHRHRGDGHRLLRPRRRRAHRPDRNVPDHGPLQRLQHRLQHQHHHLRRQRPAGDDRDHQVHRQQHGPGLRRDRHRHHHAHVRVLPEGNQGPAARRRTKQTRTTAACRHCRQAAVVGPSSTTTKNHRESP